MHYLRDIAKIRMGYTFRGSLKAATDGNIAVIQMKDASKEGVLQSQALARTELARLPEQYLLQPGDLIFRSRGLSNSAVLLEQVPGRTICIAPLMFIRVIDPQAILPAYLQWFLNIETTQQKISYLAHGTRTQMISCTSMDGLEVPTPALGRQHKIVAVNALNVRMMTLEAQLSGQRKRYTEAALLDYANGGGADSLSAITQA